MGTISKAVNLFKSIFKRGKSRHDSDTTFAPKQKFGTHTIMSRKANKYPKNRSRAYHGKREKQFHFYGGGTGWNDQAIFIPRKRNLKGYEKDGMRDTFNKRRKAS